MKTILLTRGYKALVDDQDFESLNQFKWCALVQPKVHSTKVYAIRAGGINKRGKINDIRMHRVIMGNPEGMQVDHINGDTLDNRRENLRICTNQQNQFNCSSKNNKTGYKGVSYMPWIRGKKQYFAHIMINGKNISLKYWHTAKQAGKAYDRAAKQYFGDFAHPNNK